MTEFDDDKLKKLLKKHREKKKPKEYIPIPDLSIIKPILIKISERFSQCEITIVGSAAMNRDALGRKPRDIDLVVHTDSPELFSQVKAVMEEFSQETQFKIDVLPAMALDKSRAYITAKGGRIIEDNSNPPEIKK